MTSQVMRVPSTVHIAITGRCNLDCRYCFYSDKMVGLTDLPAARWQTFFNELGSLGVMNVVLTGGEAFARPDLFELIDSIIANRMRYSILSNGTLITDKVIEKFEVGKRRLRLNYIQVSVDGSRAEIHNKSRPNSFDRVMRGLRLLVEHDFPIAVRVTINRHNVDDLENIAHLLLEELRLPQFGTNEVHPGGSASDPNSNITLRHDERLKAMRVLSELEKKYPGRIQASAGPLYMAHHVEMIERALASGHTGVPNGGKLTACGCPFAEISVLHDGTIVPCHHLSSFAMGTIGETSLQDIWLHHEALENLRNRREIPLSTLETCKDCAYQGFCTGGCPGGTYYFTGELNVRNIMGCYRIFKGEDPQYTPQDADLALSNAGGEGSRGNE